MSARQKGRLLWKLLAINIPVIGAVVLVVWLAIDYLAANYFMALMDEYNISPAETHQMFLAAIHRYLIWATLLGLGLALALSYLLTRRVLRPLSQMAEVTKRIAAGQYGDRVTVSSTDEVGRLAASFNQMASSLEQIEELRKSMVADAAHELRTPLTNMQGYIEGLRDGVVEPSPETLRMLHAEVLRLVKLSESLLALARADAIDGRDLQLESVSLRSFIESALELTGAQVADKQLVAKRRISPEADRAMADPDVLRQILLNLVENACQYAASGTQFLIETASVDGEIRVTVTSHGAEIPADDIDRIFERFYRADKSRSREHGGAGIGLSIVKQLVQAHGGQVGASSAAGDTAIWFTLPSAARS